MSEPDGYWQTVPVSYAQAPIKLVQLFIDFDSRFELGDANTTFQIGEPLHIVAIRHNRFTIHELGYAILFCHIVYSSVLFVAFPSTGAKVQ